MATTEIYGMQYAALAALDYRDKAFVTFPLLSA
jgi:hypothetical protein